MLTEEVKKNIKVAIEKGAYNQKVMTSDHVVTPFERRRFILPYDNTKRKLTSKLKRSVATSIVNIITSKINRTTRITGLEYLKDFDGGGAIITANHFSPIDSTIVRYFTNKIGKKRKLSIVVAESNIFMRGKLGWLLKSINTMPFTNDLKYLERNFNPAIAKRLRQRHLVLFYPEQEMWPGYTKPRPLMAGAYHYAAKFDVPIIPTFITMKRIDGVIHYTIHVLPLIKSNPKLSIKDNKTNMMCLDFAAKKKCYEHAYQKRLTYEFDESDLII